MMCWNNKVYAQTSLFLSPAETNQLHDAFKQKKELISEPPLSTAPPLSSETPCHYTLNGIIYTSPSSWSIWVNGERLSADHCFFHETHIQFKALDGYTVEISDQGKTFQIDIGQTYDTSHQRITIMDIKKAP